MHSNIRKKWNETILAHNLNDGFSVHAMCILSPPEWMSEWEWTEIGLMQEDYLWSYFYHYEGMRHALGLMEVKSTFVLSPSRNQVIAQRKRKPNIEIKKKSLISTMNKGEKNTTNTKKKTLNAASYIYYDHHPFLRRKKKLKNKRFDSNYVNVGVLPLYRQFHFSLMHHTESVPFLCGNCEKRVKHFFFGKNSNGK